MNMKTTSKIRINNPTEFNKWAKINQIIIPPHGISLPCLVNAFVPPGVEGEGRWGEWNSRDWGYENLDPNNILPANQKFHIKDSNGSYDPEAMKAHNNRWAGIIRTA